jgi:hypothetical protein
VWAGVDSAWEQEKLEARKMLENAAESHTSGARFVGTLLTFEDSFAILHDSNHEAILPILSQFLFALLE